MNEEKDIQTDFQFAGFVASLATGAFQHMGKIANPLSGKVERDLLAAKATIDVLVMLQQKTKGNLSVEEKKLLDNYVTNLQLNYIEESGKEDVSATPEKKEQEPEKEKTDEKKDTPEEEGDSKVKWSKTYEEEDRKKKEEKK